MDRTKQGNTEIIFNGVLAHFAIGGGIFLVFLGFEALVGILYLVKFQIILAIGAIIAWAISNLEKVPINHCALKLWLGSRVEDPKSSGTEETDVSGEGWTIRWPFEIVTWFPYPTSIDVIDIGTKESPFEVQSGSFRLLSPKTIGNPAPDPDAKTDPSGAIYLHVAMTVSLRISSYAILDFESLKKAEQAAVAVLTTLTRDVVLKEERDEEVTDPAMICERKDKVEKEVDERAKGTYKDPKLPGEDPSQDHKNLLDQIGVEILSIKIRKIDPDPEIIKAIEQQKKEELSAKSRGTEAEGVVSRIKKYKELRIPAKWGAVLDLASEFLNIRKNSNK